ncbi:unnamed protein product [Ranitomeya imitator]|uniref:Uncharacterized protein n=1 Tax=Ranitomeya imitator TaxID=111125 RepID=A0ABN9LL62_9NEOB|nr:unnamed protein product [Ranitomeya imitator]
MSNDDNLYFITSVIICVFSNEKNPFNLEGAVDEMDLHNEMSKPTPEPGLVNGQLGKKSDIMSSIIKYGVKLPYPSPIGDRKTTQETEENTSPKLPPVPKPRKLLINGKPPERSNSSLQREDSINKRKGILKRRSKFQLNGLGKHKDSSECRSAQIGFTNVPYSGS